LFGRNGEDYSASEGWFSLKNLKLCFIWEIRTFYLAGKSVLSDALNINNHGA
jgi:hypothetical protein